MLILNNQYLLNTNILQCNDAKSSIRTNFWLQILDPERNEEARRVRFQQPGVSLGRGVQNFSSHGVYSYPVAAGDTESETEVATISAAITAREISDLQNQALAAASIYPDSSLPTYSQGYKITNFRLNNL